MIIFHVHKCCVRIRFTIVVSALKTGSMPVIGYLAFKKTPEKFQIFLVPAFPLSASMNKDRTILPAFLGQIVMDLLKILSSGFGFYGK